MLPSLEHSSLGHPGPAETAKSLTRSQRDARSRFFDVSARQAEGGWLATSGCRKR